MKKKIAGIVLGMFCVMMVGIAQKGNQKVQDKIENRRIAFYTEKLELNEQEAQQFWPLFREHKELKKEINKKYKGGKSLSLLTDAEMTNYISAQLEKEEEQLALKKVYIGKLLKVLPVRKVAMIPRVEKRFKEWILEQIKQRKRNN